MNLVFFNIGWMKRYQGITADDRTTEGGGKWVHEHKWGHELFNFKEYNGYFYGFVQTYLYQDVSTQLKIERINVSQKAANILHDVLVVWVARNPKSGGTYIVGWYKHADVYRDEQKDVEKREYNGEVIGYYAKAKKEDAVILSIEERTYKIPRGKGWLGQSAVWYAGEQERFKEEIKTYVENYKKPESTRFRSFHYDKDLVKKVGARAIDLVSSYYSSLGYSVVSREQDNIGWDLDVVKEGIKLLVEVKGTSGSEIFVQLTPNELAKMKEHKEKGYRIAIVTEALSSKPTLTIFFYSKTQDIAEGWYDESGTIKLVFEEIVSARVTALDFI